MARYQLSRLCGALGSVRRRGSKLFPVRGSGNSNDLDEMFLLQCHSTTLKAYTVLGRHAPTPPEALPRRPRRVKEARRVQEACSRNVKVSKFGHDSK